MDEDIINPPARRKRPAAVLRKIKAEAEASSNEVRFVRTCRVGDEIRQGDVYLYPISGPPEVGPELGGLQLAEGVTAGSRHIIDGEATAFRAPHARQDVLTGPVLCAKERVALTHPEHADISIPAGWYEVRYQRDFTVLEDETIQRVWD